MMRTFAFVALVLVLTGCSRFQQARGPFAKPAKEPPPPYGALGPTNSPKPLNNQSPLGIASADPVPPLPPDERALIPPKPDSLVPAGGVEPTPDAGGDRPPFLRRRPQTPPGALPSPFAPKNPDPPVAKGPDAPKPDAKNLRDVKALVATANAAWKAVDTFEATLTRRELNPKGQLQSEVLLFQYRREPMSVFTRNISGNGKGREMVYNPGKFGDKMYVMLGEGDAKLAKPGFIAPPISPDDAKVTEKARYSIRDAGFGRSINTLAAAVANVEAGKLPADTITFDGEVTRPEYPYPLVGVTLKLPPGGEPLFPAGGTRLYFFDSKKDSPSYGLPVLVTATDAAGREAEYYLFEKVKSPAGLTDAHFDPDRRGKK